MGIAAVAGLLANSHFLEQNNLGGSSGKCPVEKCPGWMAGCLIAKLKSEGKLEQATELENKGGCLETRI